MSASLYSAQLYPGRALGWMALGATMHEVITRLKSEPQRFPKMDLYFDPKAPLTREVRLGLPANGLRLTFDGPEQRLRLIEVTDFSRLHIFFKPANDKERDLVRVANLADASPGPTFRHIYQRFLGPTYDGEFQSDRRDATRGTYTLSWPGVGFVFDLAPRDYAPDKDVVSLLPSAAVPTAMAVFSADSWAQARQTLYTEVLPSLKTFAPLFKGGSKDWVPDEVSLIRIHGGGRLQVFRRWTSTCFWIHLGHTKPQQLVAELGPPDAIYRKSDQRMSIHKLRSDSNAAAAGAGRPSRDEVLRARLDDLSLTDTDQSSAHTASDDGYDSHEDHDEADEADEAVEDDEYDQDDDDDARADVTHEHFYNYFYLGFDILVSMRALSSPSRRPPSQREDEADMMPPPEAPAMPNEQVAVKLVLHGNVPGSYPFNRHRRCRWEIAYLGHGDDDSGGGGDGAPGGVVINSETPFAQVEASMRDEWKSIYGSEDEARQKQRGMVLNRGWGDSPGSSCELLGGWEGEAASSVAGRKAGLAVGSEAEDATTTLYGFPGIVFEVLKNGCVSAMTVF